MSAPGILISGRGQAWKVSELTPTLSRAYKRKGEPAPKWQAVSPIGSIIRRATIAALTDAVARANWS